MLIGAMNHPAGDVLQELEWMAAMGLEFVDLTLEPPAGAVWRIDPQAICNALEGYGMEAVGHTAYYLPIAHPFESIRRASVDELRRCIDVFAQVGVRWMNVHPDKNTPMHDRAFYIGRNIESLQELIEHGRGAGVGVMIENLPDGFNNPQQLSELLDPLPELGLHLDIGHANLMVAHNTTADILERYGSRLRHVHLHDNKGGTADLHLPLGTGTVDLKGAVAALKRCGFDATITLEVFSPDRAHLVYSRDVLRAAWDEE